MKRRWAWSVGLAGLASLLIAWFAFGRTREQSYREPASGRRYRLIMRARHDVQRPAPVLFVLHAYATHPDLVVRGHFLEPLAVLQRDVLLVIPEGHKNAKGDYFWNATRACCGEGADRPDDVAYLHGVLEDVRQRVAVDGSRVWAVGVSNGGFMAYRWACSGLADLTGFVSISGAGLSAEDPTCTPTPARRVLQVHGEEDDVVRYRGGQMGGRAHPSAEASLRPFLERAHITLAPQRSQSRTIMFDRIEQRSWARSGTRIALWTVPGGGHQLRAAQLAMPSILAFLAE